MGRVPRIPAETGQWVDGKSKVSGVHSAADENLGIYHSVRSSPRLRSYSERDHALYDFSTQEGQADSVL